MRKLIPMALLLTGGVFASPALAELGTPAGVAGAVTGSVGLTSPAKQITARVAVASGDGIVLGDGTLQPSSHPSKRLRTSESGSPMYDGEAVDNGIRLHLDPAASQRIRGMHTWPSVASPATSPIDECSGRDADALGDEDAAILALEDGGHVGTVKQRGDVQHDRFRPTIPPDAAQQSL